MNPSDFVDDPETPPGGPESQHAAAEGHPSPQSSRGFQSVFGRLFDNQVEEPVEAQSGQLGLSAAPEQHLELALKKMGFDVGAKAPAAVHLGAFVAKAALKLRQATDADGDDNGSDGPAGIDVVSNK